MNFNYPKSKLAQNTRRTKVESPTAKNEMMRTSRFVLVLVCCLSLVGCSTQEIASERIAGAQKAYDSAREQIDSGDYGSALPLLKDAIDDFGLDPDQLSTALLYRSICYSQTGDVDSAASDISEAEMGSPPDALIMYAKAILLDKKGDSAAAAKLFSSARRLDSSLKKPS